MIRAPIVLAGLAVAFAVGLAGCGGGSPRPAVASLTGSGGVTTTTVTKQSLTQLWHDFAACMRAHGVQMADPVLNKDGLPTVTGGSGVLNSQGPQQADTQAMQACQAHLDAAIKAGGTKTPKPRTAQQLAQGRKFSQCMRAHGVTDFPDPQSAGSGNGGGIRIQVSGGGGSDLDP